MKYLFWAYSATWLVLFSYTLSIGWRQHGIAKDLTWLKRIVQEKHQVE